jgi:hypothetical protein
MSSILTLKVDDLKAKKDDEDDLDLMTVGRIGQTLYSYGVYLYTYTRYTTQPSPL